MVPPVEMTASNGKLNGGIVMGVLLYFLHNVVESRERREHQEFPGPDQLEVPPPGGMTASDGKLNGGIVTGTLM